MFDNLMTANKYKLRTAAFNCRRAGYSLSPWAIFPETAGCLANFCDLLDLTPNDNLAVEQNFFQKKFTLGDWPEEIQWLVTQTEDAVRMVGISNCDEGLESWKVNDVAIQRYEGPTIGIEWHRDFARDIQLIAVYTVQGQAYLDIEKYSGDVERRLLTSGTLAMLVGPDPITGKDRRIRHRVGWPLPMPPEGFVIPRISIALRMNISLNEDQ